MQIPRTGAPRELVQIGATFFVAGAVAWVLGARAIVIVPCLVAGFALALAGGAGFGRRS